MPLVFAGLQGTENASCRRMMTIPPDQSLTTISRAIFCAFIGLFGLASQRVSAASVNLANPILFVTQVPIPTELNSSVSNTFLSIVSLFSNHTADTARAGRGGDLWLRLTNGALLNLTRAAGYGHAGPQHKIGR